MFLYIYLLLSHFHKNKNHMKSSYLKKWGIREKDFNTDKYFL